MSNRSTLIAIHAGMLVGLLLSVLAIALISAVIGIVEEKPEPEYAETIPLTDAEFAKLQSHLRQHKGTDCRTCHKGDQ